MRWITSEVLPSIRKHGAYIADDVLQKMHEDIAFSEKLVERLYDERVKNGALLDYIEDIAPKARYFDLVLQSPTPVLPTVIAKDYGMTAIAFNNLLHGLGVQFKKDGVWCLYKDYAGQGYTVTKTYLDKNGKKSTFVHTCWTQRGRKMLYNLLKNNGIFPEAEKIAD